MILILDFNNRDSLFILKIYSFEIYIYMCMCKFTQKCSDWHRPTETQRNLQEIVFRGMLFSYLFC